MRAELLRLSLLRVYWLLWGVALLLYAFAPQWLTRRNPAEDLATGIAFFVIVVGLIVYSVHNRRERLWLLLAACVGTVVEAVGLATGWPFGNYTYTDSLQPQIAGFPPAVGLAWVLLSWYAWHFVMPFVLRPASKVLIASAWITAVDSVMDPVASGPLASWIWNVQGEYHGVPLTNFLGWLMTGLLIFSFAALLMPHRPDQRDQMKGLGGRETALSIGLSILLFFTLLAAWYRLWVPATMGMALAATHLRIVSRLESWPVTEFRK